jgi:hypothetical protein
MCSKHNELQVAGVWNAKDELPIEIDLPQECRYHSVFACPILRQQVRAPFSILYWWLKNFCLSELEKTGI